MEEIVQFFEENRGDLVNSTLRNQFQLAKVTTKLQNNAERLTKKAKKDPDLRGEANTATKVLESALVQEKTFNQFVSTIRDPPTSEATEKLPELVFAREKTRLFTLHSKYLVSATSVQSSATKEEYAAAKTAREKTPTSFRLQPSPAIVEAVGTLMEKNAEFASYMDSHFGPVWAFDAAQNAVPTATITQSTNGKAAKKATIPVLADIGDAKYDGVTKVCRVFYHIFRGQIGDKAVNFRSKSRSDLSFMFTFQMLTGLDELPEKGSKEAIEVAEALQSALYCVTAQVCEPLLAQADGLPVVAGKAMRNSAKTNVAFVRDEETAPPDWQLMYSLDFPKDTKLGHQFAGSLDRRFFIPLTTKVAKFVAEAVTKLVGEEAIVPMLKPYLAEKNQSIDLTAISSNLCKGWAFPKTEEELADASPTSVAITWAREPFSNPYTELLHGDGTKSLRILSMRDLQSSTFFEDCLLALHALDSDGKSTESMKKEFFLHTQQIELVAFESTGVSRSASFLKAQSRAVALSGPAKKRKLPGTDKAMVARLTEEVETLRSELRQKEDDLAEKDTEVEMLKAKRAKADNPHIEKMVKILSLAFPRETARVSTEEAA